MPLTNDGSAREIDWEQKYQDGTATWDLQQPAPALVHLIDTKPDLLPSNAHILIPGCGPGHDVFYLASKGYRVLGADISPTVVDQCRQRVEDEKIDRVEFTLADFFKHDFGNPFDAIFDYTFFCAIPPTRRDEWGRRMSELVRPGGILITLAFPTVGSLSDGPPYVVSLASYDEQLAENFEKIHQDSDCRLPPRRAGMQTMLVWRRRV